ncbi:MAG: hypothetical protein ABEK59_06980 [Halobacteria archaeon]
MSLKDEIGVKGEFVDDLFGETSPELKSALKDVPDGVDESSLSNSGNVVDTPQSVLYSV